MLAKLKKIFLWIIGTIVAVFFLMFAIANREVVQLSFAPLPLPDVEMRLFLFTGLLIVCGVLLGWLVAALEYRSRSRVKKSVQKRINALEDEITALRARHHLAQIQAMDSENMPRLGTSSLR